MESVSECAPGIFGEASSSRNAPWLLKLLVEGDHHGCELLSAICKEESISWIVVQQAARVHLASRISYLHRSFIVFHHRAIDWRKMESFAK
jgi:hypothetical protein